MRRVSLGLLLGLLLAGCGRIDVIPVPDAAAPVSPADYDLAIVSVDFDPALQGNRLPIHPSYAVLVAVENRGGLTAHNSSVSAVLTARADQRSVLRGSGTIESLAPGAITVVRIQPGGAIPAEFATYDLTVDVEPLANETLTANNRRSFTIEVAP